MFRTLAGLTVLMATILVAAIEGGPKPMKPNRANQVVGSDGPLPKCNAVNPFMADCPNDLFGTPCGPQYTTILEPLPGALLDKRFDNDTKYACESPAAGCKKVIPLKQTPGECEKTIAPY
jgi:hypothetical protein